MIEALLQRIADLLANLVDFATVHRKRLDDETPNPTTIFTEYCDGPAVRPNLPYRTVFYCLDESGPGNGNTFGITATRDGNKVFELPATPVESLIVSSFQETNGNTWRFIIKVDFYAFADTITVSTTAGSVGHQIRSSSVKVS